jgi:hypothetical protein
LVDVTGHVLFRGDYGRLRRGGKERLLNVAGKTSLGKPMRYKDNIFFLLLLPIYNLLSYNKY